METTHVVEIQAAELPGAPGGHHGRAAGERGRRGARCPAATGRLRAGGPLGRRGRRDDVVVRPRAGSRPPPDTGRRPEHGRSRSAARRARHPKPGAAADRSIFGEAGKQLLKVIAFPIGDAAGEVVNELSRCSGSAHTRAMASATTRPTTTPSRRRTSTATRRQWEKFNKGRTLLMIHGTFSRASGAFNGLPLDSMKALQAMYEDRVIAFDHQSISRDPTENIAWLLDTIPDGLTLDFDIVCHSRGGLVARSLTRADRRDARHAQDQGPSDGARRDREQRHHPCRRQALERPHRRALDGAEYRRRGRRRHRRSRPLVRSPDRGRGLPAPARSVLHGPRAGSSSRSSTASREATTSTSRSRRTTSRATRTSPRSSATSSPTDLQQEAERQHGPHRQCLRDGRRGRVRERRPTSSCSMRRRASNTPATSPTRRSRTSSSAG